jgi:hypothetical protein
VAAADVGVEAGAGLSGALGESYTWVEELNGPFGLEADAARGAFDSCATWPYQPASTFSRSSTRRTQSLGTDRGGRADIGWVVVRGAEINSGPTLPT